ncbi:MAG TPA: hypothetical protein VMF61_05850 [Candidatus Acidoferrales bacterium]|nr:hypothetical protein [Candidatus Acidoferrales bacterium]
MSRSWSPLAVVEAPSDPEALRNVTGLLERMVAAYGARSVARMLDVNAAMITRWRAGKPISAPMARRVIDLHDVLTRALQAFAPAVVAQWLVGSEPFLGGARPIDVLVTQGVVPVIEALAAIEDGAYV